MSVYLPFLINRSFFLFNTKNIPLTFGNKIFATQFLFGSGIFFPNIINTKKSPWYEEQSPSTSTKQILAFSACKGAIYGAFFPIFMTFMAIDAYHHDINKHFVAASSEDFKYGII